MLRRNWSSWVFFCFLGIWNERNFRIFRGVYLLLFWGLVSFFLPHHGPLPWVYLKGNYVSDVCRDWWFVLVQQSSHKSATFLGQTLFKFAGKRLHISTSCYPLSDGSTDRGKSMSGAVHKKHMQPLPKTVELLAIYGRVVVYNTFHTSLQTTPYKILYGHDPTYPTL